MEVHQNGLDLQSQGPGNAASAIYRMGMACENSCARARSTGVRAADWIREARVFASAVLPMLSSTKPYETAWFRLPGSSSMAFRPAARAFSRVSGLIE